MKQPKLPEDLDGLRDFLQFAVPIRHAELAADLAGLTDKQIAARLLGMCRTAGVSVGTKGDTIQFSDGRPRTGRQQATVTRTLDDLVGGIAAAALLSGKDGVTVLGMHFGPHPDRDPEQTAGPMAA